MIKGDEAWMVAKLCELMDKHIIAMEITGGEIAPLQLSHFIN